MNIYECVKAIELLKHLHFHSSKTFYR